MLAVQEITLSWGKAERGGRPAEARERFGRAYPSEKILLSGEAAVQSLYFHQRGIRFERYGRTESFRDNCSCVEKLKLVNLSIRPSVLEAQEAVEGNALYEVTFFYDEHRSEKPLRRGHNKDYHNVDSPLYRKDCLNETAFVLKPGEYGRILWNERKLDFDTGEWYYMLHIVNLCNLRNRECGKNLFLGRAPEHEYRQLADLF